MSLENIEQSTLNFLSQATNPLVRITTAYQQVVSRSDTASLSLDDYVEFLTDHELVKVTDPLALADDDSMLKALSGAGLPTEPCAILKSRVPSSRDLSAAMVEQLTSMTDALTKALQEARGTGDTVQGHQIYETLGRVEDLKKRIVEHLKSN